MAVEGALHTTRVDDFVRFRDHLRYWRRRRDLPSPCWYWTRRPGTKGRPLFYVDGHTVAPHRWVWERFCGPVPEGHLVLRACGTPRCVNPAHHRLCPKCGRRAG